MHEVPSRRNAAVSVEDDVMTSPAKLNELTAAETPAREELAAEREGVG